MIYVYQYKAIVEILQWNAKQIKDSILEDSIPKRLLNIIHFDTLNDFST
jgi:hypothetical protein